ncbi:MAG: D-alanyl-D-alanine carboxypeptidase family protein [Oscillospiraceae bacterium]
MKKGISAIIALSLALNMCVTAMAAADAPIASGEDSDQQTQQTSADFYEQEEPLAAAAIVNSDSFVDREATPENFDVPAKAALLMDEATGQVLYAKNADERLHIASITKVMTLLLVFEALKEGTIKYSDTVPISPHAFSMGGSQIWLEPGEIFTVDELLKAVCVSSANDAAVALSELVGGSETVFCDAMNRKAKALGMENTNFVNACGLDSPNQYSTARDVAIMSRALMEHTKVFEYTTIWMEYLRNGATQLVNTNKLLRSYTGTTGLKTGTTSGAGVCITATAKRQNMSLIAVALGSATSEERFDSAKKLLDFGFSNFESRPFPKQEEYPERIKVTFSTQKDAQLQYTLPENLLFLKGSANELQSQIILPKKITAPMGKGTAIGTVGLYSNGVKIKEYKIILTQDIEKINFKKSLSILTKMGSIM